jgi:phage-related baseplate assembly protein
VTGKEMTFDDESAAGFSTTIADSVNQSLEVYNEEAVTGDSTEITGEELRTRAKAFYATQNRAVTKQDYESLVYNMPAKFGFVKRVKIVNDPSATNKRIAMYILSEDQNGKLTTANTVLKNNLKTWLSNYKGMNDIIDVFDAKVVNFGIDFTILADRDKDTRDVMFAAIDEIKDYFSETAYIGEPIYLSNIYDVLNKTTGVIDVKKVSIFPKTGDNYSSDTFDFDLMMSKDGTYLKAPKNVVFELKYPNQDIKGVVK